MIGVAMNNRPNTIVKKGVKVATDNSRMNDGCDKSYSTKHHSRKIDRHGNKKPTKHHALKVTDMSNGKLIK
jgi:hypothetical protein